jgi:outer membrane protein
MGTIEMNNRNVTVHLIANAAALAILLAMQGIAVPAQGQQLRAKIAVVNLQAAILGTKDGQRASQELMAKVDPKRKEFATRQNEIAQLEQQLQKAETVMSDDKKEDLARSIDEKKKRLQRDTQDAEEELQGEQQRMLQSLAQRMSGIIDKYAKDNGYSLIIETSNPSTPVVYAASEVDITKEMIALYDKGAANGSLAATPSKE